MRVRAKTVVVLVLLLGTLAYALAEEITLTTYYPSPRGVYNELRVTGNLGIGTMEPADPLDVQGDINTSGKLKEDGAALLPAGAVLYFNAVACPAGWTELPAARGRYLVGLQPGGTLGGTPAGPHTPLADLENRAVGQHTHTSTTPGINIRTRGGFQERMERQQTKAVLTMMFLEVLRFR